jgi:hypothetical protein
MENHTFGEPVPVVHYHESYNSSDSNDVENSRRHPKEEDSGHHDEPSWTVDVIRKGSNVVVGTIVINNTKLPPRRNKNKKIVWKLPASNNSNTEDDIPRFGKQDYPRLWEIYKEEKKKRRSLNKNAATNTSSSNNIDGNDSNFIQDETGDELNNMKNDQTDGNNDNEFISEVVEQLKNNQITSIDQNSGAPKHTMTLIAPPPGFESVVTPSSPSQNNRPDGNLLDGYTLTTRTTTSTKSIRPPPGFA